MAFSSPAGSPVTAAALVAAGCLGAACVTAVTAYGELSPGSLLAVTVTGALVATVGMARRAGEGSPAVGRPGLPALAALAAAAVWEVVALARDDLPTVSDLADPVLARPAVRALATVAWLAAGACLVVRPTGRVGAAMRRPAGRAAVLAGWLWIGVHFLAR